MNSDIPAGWVSTSLGELCSKLQYGWTCSGARTGRIKYLRTTDISGSEINWSDVPFCGEDPPVTEKYRLHSNDILISRAGSVGVSRRLSEVPYDAVFASYLIRLKPLDGIDPKYIEYYLRSPDYWQSISEQTTGIAVPNVNASKLAALSLPLPPLPEQRRIVAKLEELLGKVETCQERLTRLPLLLNRFRKAALTAAVEGRLNLDGINSATWQDTTLGDLATDIKTGPFGSSLHKSDYVLGGTPIINPMNLVNGKIVPSENVTVNRTTYRRLAGYSLLEGDIIIARRGEMGRCAVVTQKESGWLCGTGSAILRLAPAAMAQFIAMVISSPPSRQYLTEAAIGTTMQNLNQDLFRAMPISLPPLEEQREIVKRVTRVLSFVDGVESRLSATKIQIHSLSQSLLAKAFRGELVPQDPNDEPATALLNRIKATRKASMQEPRSKGSLRQG